MILKLRKQEFVLEVHRWVGTAGDGQFEVARSYPVAIGMAGRYGTDPGIYRIEVKKRDPDWRFGPWVSDEFRAKWPSGVVPGGDPDNPLLAAFMGFGDEGQGIHGTAAEWTLGMKASHGCIRMTVEDVEELYPQVVAGEWGTLLIID